MIMAKAALACYDYVPVSGNVNESGKIVLVLAAVSFEVALNDTIASLTHLALLTAKMYHMHQ